MNRDGFANPHDQCKNEYSQTFLSFNSQSFRIGHEKKDKEDDYRQDNTENLLTGKQGGFFDT